MEDMDDTYETPLDRARHIERQVKTAEQQRVARAIDLSAQGAQNLQSLETDLDDLTVDYGWSFERGRHPEMFLTVRVGGRDFVTWRRDGASLLGTFHDDMSTTGPSSLQAAFDETVRRFHQRLLDGQDSTALTMAE